MAYYFSAAGSAVTVVEQLPKVACSMDAEISRLLLQNLERRGVSFRLEAKVTAVGAGWVTVEQNGAEEKLPCDRVLLCAGRKPVTEGFGLETLAIEIGEGGIETDEHCRTSFPNVCAVGDCNGRVMLAHAAYREAEVAVNCILGRPDGMSLPGCSDGHLYSPEAAAVGLTEEEALRQDIDAEMVRLSIELLRPLSGRAGTGRRAVQADLRPPAPDDGGCASAGRTRVGTDLHLRHVHRQPDDPGANEAVCLPPSHGW